MSKTVIIIPCFNEELRLPVPEYKTFLTDQFNVTLCLVNDGSSDNTLKVLKEIHTQYPANVLVVDKKINGGKAEAVRTGVLHCLKNTEFDFIGYADADLSTSLEELISLQKYLKGDVEFCFGSRILKIGSLIERSGKRHYIGRIVATFISNALDITVYDSQCGCKLFTKNTAAMLFEQPFISKWLFDVELFARMLNKYGKQKAIAKMLEIPLDKWINKDGSKVKATYFFKLWSDLFRIRKTLKRLP